MFALLVDHPTKRANISYLGDGPLDRGDVLLDREEVLLGREEVLPDRDDEPLYRV